MEIAAFGSGWTQDGPNLRHQSGLLRLTNLFVSMPCFNARADAMLVKELNNTEKPMNRRHFVSTSAAALAFGFVPMPSQANARAPVGFIRSNWSRDPFAHGSYSFFAKGSARRDVRALARPVDERVFFAGEATHPRYNSTVHAAYESGLIAAKAIAGSKAQRIAVIGAGMSGLTAAQALVREGRSVVVLEARARVGGRIWTDNRLGVPLDIGASWIHGDVGNPLVAEAARMGAETRRTTNSYIARGGDGRVMADAEEPDWLEEVLSIQHSAGAGLNEINTRAYVRDVDYDGDDLLFPKGYAQLLASKTTGIDLRLRWSAKRIQHGVEGVTIHDNDGSSLTVDAVLVTVPLGVLKSGDLAFDPPLPAKKQTAINRLGMGLLDKVYLKYSRVFWDETVTWIATPENGLPRGQFNQWLNLYPYTGKPIIMAFNGGQPARDLARFADQEIVRRAVSTLSQAYPS